MIKTKCSIFFRSDKVVEVVAEVGDSGVPDLKKQAESPKLIISAAAVAAEISLILLANFCFIT
jgi:hypothetical protein